MEYGEHQITIIVNAVVNFSAKVDNNETHNDNGASLISINDAILQCTH